MKLVMDLSGATPLCRDMNDNRHDLIIRLCTVVGMIMEDTSELALTVRGVDDDNLAGRLGEIDEAVRQMQVLTTAAKSLAGPADHAG